MCYHLLTDVLMDCLLSSASTCEQTVITGRGSYDILYIN